MLVTLDRFRTASGIFGVFSVPGEPIPASQQVDLLELDTMAMLEDTWATARSALTARELTGTGVTGMGAVLAGLDPEEVLGMPSVESLLALRRIRDEAASGTWSRVVVDLSGGVDPFDLLRVPQMVADTIERLWPRHRRLAASADNARIARVVAVLDALVRDCADVDELLFDSTGVDVHLVVAADRYGAETAERYQAVLQVMGLPLSTLLVNHVLPEGFSTSAVPGDSSSYDTWRDRQVAAQTDAVERLRGVAGDSELICLPLLSEPIDSVLMMRRLGVRIEERSNDEVGPQAAKVERESGSGVDAVYRMSWEQRLPDPAGLQLGRSGDDLMITVSGVRRRVRLPSVLRRCLVLGAQWDGGVLTVRFRPDPGLWPQQ